MGPARCVGAPSSANNLTPPRTGVNGATGDLMASRIRTRGSLGRQCHREHQVLLCQSQVVEAVVARPTIKKCDVAPGTLHSLKDSGELREPWLPSTAVERFGFRVSACDEGTSPTNAARFDWRRCLARTEAFE